MRYTQNFFGAVVNMVSFLLILIPSSRAGVWREDFRDEKAAEAWMPQKPPWVRSQRWQVKNGVYVAQVIGTDQSYSVTGEKAWDDYSIEVKVRYTEKGPPPPLHFGVGVRYQDFDFGHHYAFGFILPPIGRNAVPGIIAWGGGIGRFIVEPFPIEPDRWYTLKMEVKGTHFECWVDGELVGQFDHSVIMSGKAALWGGPGDFEFDDVTISGPKIPNRALAVQPQRKLATRWGEIKFSR